MHYGTSDTETSRRITRMPATEKQSSRRWLLIALSCGDITARPLTIHSSNMSWRQEVSVKLLWAKYNISSKCQSLTEFGLHHVNRSDEQSRIDMVVVVRPIIITKDKGLDRS